MWCFGKELLACAGKEFMRVCKLIMQSVHERFECEGLIFCFCRRTESSWLVAHAVREACRASRARGRWGWKGWMGIIYFLHKALSKTLLASFMKPS